ncbi:MAG: bifunctional adenosylcobinamide kinase/adenosylcobinamide-phosphate guanylyltransferase [Firmicutes bacterium]|nr:bifunctional adenosylcobinamide kinase/adenosylcobinamide-phosphate guanylyltransferase [Bacillota bacterium]
MGQLLFVTGPVRSGKSRYALQRALAWGEGVVYAATYRMEASDLEMADRVRRHREERPASWRTLEAPEDLASVLKALQPPPSGLVLDCLTLWLGGRMHKEDDVILAEWRQLLDFLAQAPWPTIVVGNEVGWSLVSPEPELRRFRDLAGWLAQATAAAAEEAWLSVAGYQLPLK